MTWWIDNTGMFCKHSPDLVFGLSHPSVQGNSLPGTGILLLWFFCSLIALHFHHSLENWIAGLLILKLVRFIMSWIFVLSDWGSPAGLSLALACWRAQVSVLPLHCTSCGCRICLPSHPCGRSCSSPHLLSLARHPLGRPCRSSHPVDLLPIHPCGRCRRSSHPRGRTCSSSQPLALTAGSYLLSLVSHPWGRLDKSSQPSYLISFFPLFSLLFLSMNLCDLRLNEFLLSHILSHPSHLEFSAPPSVSTTEYVILAYSYRSPVFPVH